jgi:hypothetical protein
VIYHLDCRGCGTALEPQTGIKGSLRRYHRECQFVRRTWYRLTEAHQRMERYHALKQAGAFPEVAKFGSASRPRFEGAMAALEEETA